MPRPILLPWLILCTMLGVTWLAWDHEHQTARKALHSQFDFALRDKVSWIEQRAASYEQMLRGVQGLFATTRMTNREALHQYIESVRLDASFSGIQAIGVIEWVPSRQKAGHVARMMQTGLADYSIHPDEGGQDGYAPTVQRESHVGDNRALMGLNSWADPRRREAMERARDSGMAALTGKLRLVVDAHGKAVPGFVMYLPIFEQGQPRDSVAQRRSHLTGWVFAVFNMSDFMATLYQKSLPGLSVAIYDGVTQDDTTLMYQAGDATREPAGAADSSAEYIVVAGHTWTLAMKSGEAFNSRFGRSAATEMAVTGVGLSLSMALLAWLMLTGRARALKLAATMTDELRHMAQHDPLTGLPNRALFSDRVLSLLAYAKRHDRRFAIIYLDLDGFKPVNDRYGHAAGDKLLQQVARRLQDSVRASDTVGRMGGDEFVVLVSELNGVDAALTLAEKIRHAVHKPFTIDGHTLTMSCSLGVSVYPEDGHDEIELTRRADEAMYRAKDAGRNRVACADASADSVFPDRGEEGLTS